MKKTVSLLAAAAMAVSLAAPAYADGVAAGKGASRATSAPLVGLGLAGLIIPAAVVVVGITAVAVSAADDDDDGDTGAAVSTNGVNAS